MMGWGQKNWSNCLAVIVMGRDQGNDGDWEWGSEGVGQGMRSGYKWLRDGEPYEIIKYSHATFNMNHSTCKSILLSHIQYTNILATPMQD